MAYEEVALYAAIGAVMLAVGLWVVTNWHIRATKQDLKTYGEAARASTESFVHGELVRVEKGFQDRTTALEAAVSAEPLETRFDQLVLDMKGRFDELGGYLNGLPGRMANAAGAATSHEVIAMQNLAKGHEADIEGALSMQEAMASQDPEAIKYSVMKKVMDFKFSNKYAKEHPLIVAALEIGKPKIIEMVSEGLGTSTRGYGAPSVRMTRKNEEM